MPHNPNSFGHHTVSLRAQFAPEGAEISMVRATLLAGRDQVVIPAALVPEGASAPGYPYEHIAQAMFTPDQDDISNSARTGSQQPRPAEALTGMQRDTPMPGNNVQRSPRQLAAASANTPQFGAPGASDSNSASTAPTPRRSVRSAQVNSSTAAPNPRLDTSRDAIDAAARFLSAPIGSGSDVTFSPVILNQSQAASPANGQRRDARPRAEPFRSDTDHGDKFHVVVAR